MTKQKKISGIYAIKNIVTNRYYIGSSNNIYLRWRQHINQLKRGIHHSIKLQRSFNKHGLDCFEFKILKEVKDSQKLFEIEEEFIKLYESWQKGYNVKNQTKIFYTNQKRLKKSNDKVTEEKQRLNNISGLVCRLNILMAEKDPPITQTQLIEDLNLASHTVNKLYNNKFIRFDKKTIEKLCEYFRCTISDLFDLR